MVLPKQKLRPWSWLQNNLGLLVIFVTWLAIIGANYTPNTWFLSWDMITSSFNPVQMLSRSLVGVWQDFQGLGVLGGHGYGASLLESVVQLVLSVFLPESVLRYALMFLLVLVGAWGAYVLVLQRVLVFFKLPRLQMSVVGGFVGVVYLLNLATVQTFYVGLEPFMWAYAVFPWVLWQLFGVLESPSWKGFFGFLCLNLGLSVIGLIPPVFIAYVFFVGIVLLIWWWQYRSRTRFWIGVQLVSLVVVANLYWLVPVGIFAVFQSPEYLNSQLNQMSTDEFIYRSQYYGQLDKAAVFESFYFDSLDQDRFGQGAYSSIMLPWQQWLNASGVRWLGYGLLMGGVIGWALMMRYLGRTRKPIWSLGILGFLSFAILANGTPVLAELSYPLRSLPILNQAFRLPFSKISMFLSLFVAMGWGVVLIGLWQLVAPRLKQVGQALWWFFVLVCVSGVLLANWPVFQGHFLYAGARVVLPKEYSEFITIFQEKINPRARVALLPIFTYTGWDMHNWGQKQGYTGSGFWWYAIPQSLLHRSFDVWNSTNEAYRNELQHAIYDQDLSAIKVVLHKYQVNYVLLDSSIYLPEKPNEQQRLIATKKLLSENADFITVAESGNLTLLQFKPVPVTTLFAPPFYSLTQPLPERARTDYHFKNLGFNVPSTERIFPFDQLSLPKVTQAEIGEVLRIVSTQPADVAYQALMLPQLTDQKIRFNVILRTENNDTWLQLQPILPLFVFKTSVTGLLDVAEIPLPANVRENAKTIRINDYVFDLNQEQESELQLLGELSLRFKERIILQVGESATNSFDLTAQTWEPSTAVFRAEKNDQNALMTAYVPVQKYVWRPNENSLVNCSFNKVGQIKRTAAGIGVEYQAENRGAACDYLDMREVSLDTGLLLHIKGKNSSGQSLKLYVRNLATDKIELEYRLPKGSYDEVLSLLPVRESSQGLSLVLETRSFGNEVARNSVETIELFAIPTEVLLSTAVQKNQNVPVHNQNIVITSVGHLGSGLHWLTTHAEQKGMMVLSTSYDPFWFAFDLTHMRFLPHGLFNNWENAWEVATGRSQIILVYLPQLLVWSAFMIMLAVFMMLRNKALQPNKTLLTEYLKNSLVGKP